MITLKPYAKGLLRYRSSSECLLFFHFKPLADERIRSLAVKEALSWDLHISFLGSALLKALLSVCSGFVMHKIDHLLDGLDCWGVQFFFCLQLSSSEWWKSLQLGYCGNLCLFPVDSCERLGCFCWHSSASVLWWWQEVNRITCQNSELSARKRKLEANQVVFLAYWNHSD